MADLVVTPANVGVGSSAKVATVLAGEAIDRGEWVYYDALTSKYMLADNTDADRSVAVGQAQSAAAADGDYFILMRSGEGIPGATLNLGEEYYLSSTPGKRPPSAISILAITSCLCSAPRRPQPQKSSSIRPGFSSRCMSTERKYCLCTTAIRCVPILTWVLVSSSRIRNFASVGSTLLSSQDRAGLKELEREMH